MTRRDRIILLRRAAGPLARDMAGLAGAALIVVGVAEWSRPAAMIVAGAALLATAILLARRAG